MDVNEIVVVGKENEPVAVIKGNGDIVWCDGYTVYINGQKIERGNN